jgi:exodeoxyribonuclease VII large subunit
MTLFDPEQADEPRRVTLVRLSGLIAQAAAGIGRFAVEGEIHRPQTGRTGWVRFVLRDRAAQINVSVPASKRRRCRIEDGERVCVTGRLDWVSDWGQLQLVAEEVLPVGEGAIAAMIAEARRSLDADGLLTRPRRRIPRLPAGIGVVCGFEAAVRADIESVVAARFPGYPVTFWQTTVSGPGAVDNVMTGLRELDAQAGIDVIVLARGGGDATALLPFSDEDLCRAVCAVSTPVVSAIGHEGDRPLVDEVADLRCGTPSLAAGAVVPDRAALVQELDGLLAAVAATIDRRLERAAVRLTAVDRRRAVDDGVTRASGRLAQAAFRLRMAHPQRELVRAGERLERIDWRAPATARLDRAVRAMGAAHAQVEALSPARVLERGYAVVRREGDGTVVRRPDQLQPGDRLSVEVAAGRFGAVADG